MAENKAALEAFVKEVAVVTALLEKLQEHLESHMDSSPEKVDWGYVGSARKVANDLEDILKFCGVAY